MTGRIAMMFVDFALGAAGQSRQCARGDHQRAQRAPARCAVDDGGRLPALDLIPWNAIFAPAQTPRPIVERLNGELRRIIADPTVKQRLAAIGFDASSTPEELDAFVREDLAKWTGGSRTPEFSPNRRLRSRRNRAGDL